MHVRRANLIAALWCVLGVLHGLPPSHADTLEIDESVLAAQQQRVQTMQNAAAATISIFGLDGGGGGSGVIVTPDGYALTNYHVSSACGDHMRCGLNDGRLYDAVIVGVDATGDLSLIKLFGRDDFPTAPLGDSNQVQVGQWCFAAGNPFVLATNLQPSISLGIVSGVHRYQYPAGTLLEYTDCIQTDAAVNPGNSGGPLFNLAGEVIGINGRCSFEKRGRVNVGVGYAISANQIKYFFGMLRSGRLVDHATLGATVSTDDAGAVMVSNILNSSDAYRRGLRYGDQIVSLADREVATTNSFKNILGTLPKGWRVPLEIRRDGTMQRLLVRLDGVHTDKELNDLIASEAMQLETTEKEKADDPTPTPESKRHPLEPDKSLIESQFEQRVGFANYFFNREYRQTLWRQMQQLGDFSNTSATWSFSGSLAGEATPLEISVNASTATVAVGTRSLQADLTTSISEIVGERRETGILVALRALQDLLRNGPEKIGETIYLGKMPYYATRSFALAEQPLGDVLQTAWYDARVLFTIDESTGQIQLIEVFGDSTHDPVELYLDEYRVLKDKSGAGDSNGARTFPHRPRLQYGTEPVIVCELEVITLVDPTQSAEAGNESSNATSPAAPAEGAAQE